MKQNEVSVSALNSYKREIKRLKSCSPEWKPISLKEYVQEYQKRSEVKNLH
ncbi:MAG: hypothetical protein NTZ55_04410 [Candidatus Roizmanbacteria bacterium]|nr:hypothetical protein [Candidatus Roizmanbacteria bacterium]